MTKDTWEEHSADFKPHEQLEEELEDDELDDDLDEDELDHGIVARLVARTMPSQVHDVDGVFSSQALCDGHETQSHIPHAVEHHQR